MAGQAEALRPGESARSLDARPVPEAAAPEPELHDPSYTFIEFAEERGLDPADPDVCDAYDLEIARRIAAERRAKMPTAIFDALCRAARAARRPRLSLSGGSSTPPPTTRTATPTRRPRRPRSQPPLTRPTPRRRSPAPWARPWSRSRR
jgi:hypothetical protein